MFHYHFINWLKYINDPLGTHITGIASLVWHDISTTISITLGNFIKKDTPTQCFPVNLSKFLRTPFFNRPPPVVASGYRVFLSILSDSVVLRVFSDSVLFTLHSDKVHFRVLKKWLLLKILFRVASDRILLRVLSDKVLFRVLSDRSLFRVLSDGVLFRVLVIGSSLGSCVLWPTVLFFRYTI